MQFLIADSFTEAISRLPSQDQKAVKTSAFDLQMDPSSPGLQFHRIDKSKDPNFWSLRVSRDIRIIVHKTQSSILLAYVDRHDKAYVWAERRRIEAHPRTGAIQIVEVRERVEELAPAPSLPLFEPPPAEAAQTVAASPPIFAAIAEEDLLLVGVPPDWLSDVRDATEDSFFEIAPHLPAEAAEALLEYAATGVLPPPTQTGAVDAYAHPDAGRRIRVVENREELEQALDFPWDKWTVFLHPSQRAVVERDYSGPARVAGSAGTGKTVVALHRAARIARADPGARILLTTFSDPLANALSHKLAILAGPQPGVIPRITVASFEQAARELHELALGRRPHVASDDQVAAALASAAQELDVTDVSPRFLKSEWNHVIDAWQLTSLQAYSDVPRLGRKNRMGVRQRERLWPVFERARTSLNARGLTTSAQVFGRVAEHFAGRPDKPFTHIVVDEAQDLGVPELRMLAAIAPASPGALFFAGDLGQRIFQQPFSWLGLGVDVRGRSHTLRVNYRTSHQIRQAADRLLPGAIHDVDGMEDDRRGTVSVFNGPPPEVVVCDDESDETEIAAAFLKEAAETAGGPGAVGVFVRSREQLPRARAAVRAAGLDATELSERAEDATGRVSIGVMHLAKGLEFRAVAVIACDDEVLPLQARIDSVADEVELEDVYETERQLLYVACTRARDRLLVMGVKPASEFLFDLRIEP
jgi:hypothetical protein